MIESLHVVPVRRSAAVTVCPYCHDGFDDEAPTRVCDACLARHHPDCWSLAARCSACSGTQVLAREARPARTRPGRRLDLAVGAVLAEVGIVASLSVDHGLAVAGWSRVSGRYWQERFAGGVSTVVHPGGPPESLVALVPVGFALGFALVALAVAARAGLGAARRTATLSALSAGLGLLVHWASEAFGPDGWPMFVMISMSLCAGLSAFAVLWRSRAPGWAPPVSPATQGAGPPSKMKF